MQPQPVIDTQVVWKHKRVRTSSYTVDHVLDGVVYYRPIDGKRQLCLVESIWLAEYEPKPSTNA